MATTYVIKSGDTLSSIASRYEVKGGYQALASYNNISNPNNISVGQKLVIPESTTSGATKTSTESAKTSESTATSAGQVKVTCSTLNVRKGPGTGYGVWGTLSAGKVLSYTEEKSGWLKINYNGSVGWISKQYTSNVSSSSGTTETKTDTSSQKQETSSTTTMYVTASDSLNVRQGPGTNYGKMGTLNYGAQVAVISSSNGWSKISFNGGTAYVYSSYLSKSKPSSASAGTTTFAASKDIYQLTQEKLGKVASGGKKYFSLLTNSMSIANITTKQRACCYVAQLAHESANFYYMEEIADGSAYEGRTDLGNTQKGDGKKYKGRGPIQITGRYNYTKAGQALGIDLVNHPELASNPEIGFKLSAWYWNYCNLNSYCDNYDFVGLTKAINGGTNGLKDRQSYYEKAKKYF